MFRPLLSAGDRIFEVGAGMGCNLKAFELAGFEATGVEPDVGFHEFATTRLRAKVRRESLFDVPSAPTYDFVLLLHVIEYFRSPRAALEHIHGLLRPSGRLLVECPGLCRRHADHSQLFHFAHIHNFTWPTLRMLAARCGFQVERRLSEADDPTLRALFVRVAEKRLPEDPNGYEATMRELRDAQRPVYRLTTGYWRTRFEKIRGYDREWTVGRRRVREILRLCDEHARRSET